MIDNYDVKKSLAFAVGTSNSIVMLYILIKIWIFEEVTVAEPSLIILLSEITLSSIGVYCLFKVFITK